MTFRCSHKANPVQTRGIIWLGAEENSVHLCSDSTVADRHAGSSGRGAIIPWPYHLLTPATVGRERWDGWHYNSAPLTSQTNLTSSPVHPSQVCHFREGAASCHRSQNQRQPADDQGHASRGSHLAKTRVPCQGLVVERSTEHPHACYQEGSSLPRQDRRHTVYHVVFEFN